MSRRKEREKLFKIIFQEYVNPNSYDLTEEDSEYVRDNFTAIKDNMSTIEEDVIKNTTRWSYNEIGLVEKVLLIVAFHELANLDHRIVANEAIELSKKYGNQHSGKFINGILSNKINIQKEDNNDPKEIINTDIIDKEGE